MRIQISTTGARRRAAFTLMEVMVVVAILVVLAGVAGVFVFGALDDAKGKAAESSAASISAACDLYKLRLQDFPDRLEDLLTPPDGGRPFLNSNTDIYDPWGKPFQYDKNGAHSNGRKVDVWAIDPGTNKPHGNWREQ